MAFWKKCTVIYYPLRNEKNCGFHIKKIVGDSLEDFVYKPMTNQIFVAAHELGHIYMVAENVIRIARYDEFLLDEDDKKQYVE